MNATRKARRIWRKAAREMPLDMCSIITDLDAVDEARDKCIALLGRDAAGKSKHDERRTAEALLAHGITGLGRLDSSRDREGWLVPEYSRHIWETVVDRVRRSQTQPILEDLVQSQTHHGWVLPIVIPEHASTGRTHIEAPRLQGLSRDMVARYINMDLVYVDQVAAEPHVMAYLSGDAQLAADLTGDPYRELARDLGVDRSDAKSIFMSIPYGSGPDRIASMLRISRGDAVDVIDQWNARYPDAASWVDEVRDEAKTGQVRLFDGTRLSVESPHLGPSYVGQGTGAVLTHEWTIAVHSALPAEAELAWPVHDALVVELPDEDARDEIGQTMVDALSELSIPLHGKVE
ncbi:DNA polymerase [Brevibacterium linens]|uniref:DNA polymerase family A n=1 Tax=Brevibacterium linens TaxID=1703 RepID=A0A2H1IL49_BRELN|nr:DNA polymerase [Brevibacterium linens]SMX75884.1 DNA polymerase family A [Brevibacterium linens]